LLVLALLIAAPVIAGAVLLNVGVGGAAKAVAGLRAGSRTMLAAGALIFISAVGLAVMGLNWMSGGAGAASQAAEIASPRARWNGPLPRTLIQSQWDRTSPMMLVANGTVDHVLLPDPYPDNGQREIDDETRATFWKEVIIRQDGACLQGVAAGVRPDYRCFTYAPRILRGGKPAGPYFLQEVEKGVFPEDSETARYYLVDGASRQLIATCRAGWPTPNHPFGTSLSRGARIAISNSFAECRRQLYAGGLIAAIDQT
jgi:hypothetical protein